MQKTNMSNEPRFLANDRLLVIAAVSPSPRAPYSVPTVFFQVLRQVEDLQQIWIKINYKPTD